MIDFIILLPLMHTVVGLVILFWGRMLPKHGGILGIFSTFVSSIISLIVVCQTIAGKIILPRELYAHWFMIDFYPFDVGVFIDGLSVTLLALISLTSFLVHIYSIGYLEDARRVQIYFSFLSFFTAALIGLCLSRDMVVLMLCWSLMGISAYGLQEYHHEQSEVRASGWKSYTMVLLSDGLLLCVLILLFKISGTLSLNQVYQHHVLGYMSIEQERIIGYGVICCVMVRCSLIPFQNGLIYAVQGPAPISALVSSVGLGASGFFLMEKFFFLFKSDPLLKDICLIVGLLSALVGACLALTAVDIKKIISFAAISEMGYIIMAYGTGYAVPSFFHFISYLLCISLLFCLAGSVEYTAHTRDITELGGLAKRMPTTAIVSFLGVCALSSLWPSIGFFSKMYVVNAVTASYQPYILWFLRLSIFLTTVYSFRLWFLIFVGDPRNIKRFEKASEVSTPMLLPVWIYVVLLVSMGLIIRFFHLIDALVPEKIYRFNSLTASGGILLIIAVGIIAAWSSYNRSFLSLSFVIRRVNLLYLICYHNFWIENIWRWIAINPIKQLMRFLAVFDTQSIERICNQATVQNIWIISKTIDTIENLGIERLITACRITAVRFSERFQQLCTGFIQQYIYICTMCLIIGILWLL